MFSPEISRNNTVVLTPIEAAADVSVMYDENINTAVTTYLAIQEKLKTADRPDRYDNIEVETAESEIVEALVKRGRLIAPEEVVIFVREYMNNRTIH